MSIITQTIKNTNASNKTSTLPSATTNQMTASAPLYYHDHIKINKAVQLAITNLTNQLENFEMKVQVSIPKAEDKNVTDGLMYNVLQKFNKPNCVPFIVTKKQLLDKFIKNYYIEGFASMVISFDVNNVFSIDNANITYIDTPNEIILGSSNTTSTEDNFQAFQLSNLDVKLSKLNNQPIRFTNTSRAMLASEIISNIQELKAKQKYGLSQEEKDYLDYFQQQNIKPLDEVHDEFYIYNPFDPINIERKNNITGKDPMSIYIKKEMEKIKILFYISHPDKELYNLILALERTNSKAQQQEVDNKSFSMNSCWGYDQTIRWMLSKNSNLIPLPTLSVSSRNDLAFYTNCVSPFFAIIKTILAANAFHASSYRTANTNGMPNTILSLEPVPNADNSASGDSIQRIIEEQTKTLIDHFNTTPENTTPIAAAYFPGNTIKIDQIPSTLQQQDRNETIKQLEESILVFTGTTSANSLSQKAQYANNATQYNTENFEKSQGKIQVLLLDSLTHLLQAVGGKKYNEQIITLDSSKFGPTIRNTLDMVNKFTTSQVFSRGDAMKMLKKMASAIELFDTLPEPTEEDYQRFAGQRNVNALPTQNNQTLNGSTG
jgi:hypothetical protein